MNVNGPNDKIYINEIKNSSEINSIESCKLGSIFGSVKNSKAGNRYFTPEEQYCLDNFANVQNFVLIED